MRLATMAVVGGLLFWLTACSHPAQEAASSRSPLSAGGNSPSAHIDPSSSGSESAASAVGWRGQFAGYGNSAWQASWGYVTQSSFGQAQLSRVSDPSAPGGGPVLRVIYGRGSSDNSCGDCPNPGGGQFYTSFANAGHRDLSHANVLYLRYYVRFPAGFDFGRGGKLPGLYGGPIGQESGGHHGNAFSTRYMWRMHSVQGSLTGCSSAMPCAEVYMYSPQVSNGYGRDIGGSWGWQADGRWHMIEQAVDRANGDITVWYDGVQVLSAPGALGDVSGIRFAGILFSTFFGGHDTSWGPSKTEYAYFADFAVSTRRIAAQ